MRLLRFVAVALMVTVSVASFGCGEGTAVKPPAETTTPADGSSTESAATDPATSGTTPVSLTITGMT